MKCHLCGHEEKPESGTMSDDVNLAIDHLRLLHPDEWEPIERWSDGAPVIVDDTLTPEDFTDGGEGA